MNAEYSVNVNLLCVGSDNCKYASFNVNNTNKTILTAFEYYAFVSNSRLIATGIKKELRVSITQAYGGNIPMW